MDQQQSAILSYVSIFISVFGTVFGFLNGHRIRSTCCGQRSSLEIADLTPKKSEALIDDDAHPFDKVPIPS